MYVATKDLPQRELYNILISAVAPRPIAWVSSLSAYGQPNLAPFSFFNCVSARPPMLGFSPGLREPQESSTKAGEPKDTLRNIRETKEFVISVVTYELLESMNLTSGEYPHTVNEFEIAKLTPVPSKFVRPPRVGESPVSFECKLNQVIEFSTEPSGGNLVIGEIVYIHIDDTHMKDGRLDRDSLDLLGRMGGMQYARTRDRIELARPKVG
ncbi:MAG TPA: flavin reductase family protein [Candidatus Sulfotelmatobacter sp.]|nr:flavin reductase family protein [Candidatus Sulfotelmatobacter sp.]